MARDNRTLGRFHLVGIPSAPRGVPQIEVTFDIDANGILNVSAKDMATSKEQAITITASSGLTKENVEKMVKEAERYAEEDRRRKEEIEARNQLDSMIYNTEKMLNENREKIPIAEIKPIEDAIASAKQALNSGDAGRIREALDQLTKASHRLAEAMYRQAGARQQAAGGEAQPSGGPAEGEVVDADFEDMGGKK